MPPRTPPTEDNAIDTFTTIGDGITCWKCAYNLRGLRPTQRCPECGEPVVISITGMRVDGKYLVVRDGVRLPKRCIRSNEPVDNEIEQKKLYYCPAWIYILIVINLLIMVVVYLVVRKGCTLNYFISKKEKKKLSQRTTIAVLALIGCVVLMFAPFILDAPDNVAAITLTVGGIGLVASIIAALIISNFIAAAKHKKGWFWISGISKEFLAQVQADQRLHTDEALATAGQLNTPPQLPRPMPPRDPAAPN